MANVPLLACMCSACLVAEWEELDREIWRTVFGYDYSIRPNDDPQLMDDFLCVNLKSHNIRSQPITTDDSPFRLNIAPQPMSTHSNNHGMQKPISVDCSLFGPSTAAQPMGTYRNDQQPMTAEYSLFGPNTAPLLVDAVRSFHGMQQNMSANESPLQPSTASQPRGICRDNQKAVSADCSTFGTNVAPLPMLTNCNGMQKAVSVDCSLFGTNVAPPPMLTRCNGMQKAVSADCSMFGTNVAPPHVLTHCNRLQEAVSGDCSMFGTKVAPPPMLTRFNEMQKAVSVDCSTFGTKVAPPPVLTSCNGMQKAVSADCSTFGTKVAPPPMLTRCNGMQKLVPRHVSLAIANPAPNSPQPDDTRHNAAQSNFTSFELNEKPRDTYATKAASLSADLRKYTKINVPKEQQEKSLNVSSIQAIVARNPGPTAKRQSKTPEDLRRAKPPASRRLHISNIPFWFKQHHLAKLFKGFGFVTFRDEAMATNIRTLFDGKDVDGRVIEVNFASRKFGPKSEWPQFRRNLDSASPAMKVDLSKTQYGKRPNPGLYRIGQRVETTPNTVRSPTGWRKCNCEK